MRVCSYCESSIEHRPVSASVCGRKCSRLKWRDRNIDFDKQLRRKWAVENRDKRLEHAKRYRDKNPEKCRQATIKWRDNNPWHLKSYAAHLWANKHSPEADRVLLLAGIMSERQRVRFADWLLRVGHRSLQVFKVDDFVASYNSEGI